MPGSDPQIHHPPFGPPQGRHSIRLKGYDYSQVGAYFVTVVTQRRVPLFGDVLMGEMRLNRYGEIVHAAWVDLPRHYRHVELGAFIVMPNHVHGIIILNDTGRGGSIPGQPPVTSGMTSGTASVSESAETRPYGKRRALPEIVRAFKSVSARHINLLRHTEGMSVWQRNYYDHIIRNQQDLELTWLYIESNPSQWITDDENPQL